MNKTIFLIVFLMMSLKMVGQYDEKYGKPLIVLTETNPWLMVIGSDVASFVLYEKGQIIYKQIENKKLKVFEIDLSSEELNDAIKSLEISDEIYKLEENIEASDWTDQPSNILELNINQLKKVSVYGRLNDDECRQKTPKSFLSVYDNIKKYKNTKAKEWIPHKIEIMFWDYNYAPNKRKWIKGFPDLNSPTTIKFDNDSFSVFIGNKDLEQFKKYYKSMGEKEAVEINGRKMAISYRMPFPNLK